MVLKWDILKHWHFHFGGFYHGTTEHRAPDNPRNVIGTAPGTLLVQPPEQELVHPPESPSLLNQITPRTAAAVYCAAVDMYSVIQLDPNAMKTIVKKTCWYIGNKVQHVQVKMVLCAVRNLDFFCHTYWLKWVQNLFSTKIESMIVI